MKAARSRLSCAVTAARTTSTSLRRHRGHLHLQGKVTFTTDGRDEVLKPGDAFYVPPGHLQRAEAGAEPGATATGQRDCHRLRRHVRDRGQVRVHLEAWWVGWSGRKGGCHEKRAPGPASDFDSVGAT